MKAAKRILIAFLMVQFLFPNTLNVTAKSYGYAAEAVVLNKLGLYAGGNAQYFDPDLGSELQRQSAVILLVKMFGKQSAALAMSSGEVNDILSQYADNNLLASFARQYMAYAIKTGMVTGTSVTPKKLGATEIIDSQSFACLILKNMGYLVADSAAFTHSLDTLGGLGNTDPAKIAELNYKKLIRDDAVGIIYWALKAVMPDGDALIVKLIKDKVVPVNTAVGEGFVKYEPSTGKITLLPEKQTVVTDRDVILGQIRDALLNAASSITIPVNSASDTIEKVSAIINDVLAANPKILYYYGIDYYKDTGYLVFKYKKDAATAKSHLSLLEQKAQSVLARIIKPGMTDYMKETAVHDYIVNNCSYDMSAPPPPESYSAYGALCLGTAVCEGYSEAMQLLLSEAGLECKVVRGNAVSKGVNQSHAWNIVKVGGRYYHLDASWDDLIMPGGAILTYTYFNLPDSDISRDHSWDKAKYPACVATVYNYYEYNAYIANGYDAFVSYAVNKFKKGIFFFTVKLGNTQDPGFDMDKALDAILKATKVDPLIIRPVDAYGILDMRFK